MKQKIIGIVLQIAGVAGVFLLGYLVKTVQQNFLTISEENTFAFIFFGIGIATLLCLFAGNIILHYSNKK